MIIIVIIIILYMFQTFRCQLCLRQSPKPMHWLFFQMGHYMLQYQTQDTLQMATFQMTVVCKK